MSEDENHDDIVTEEMLWDRIPQTEGQDRAETYYELSARIFARGQYDEALALAETARDIYSEMGASAPSEGLAQAYSAIGYNLNQLKRIDEAATAMSKAVELLRESKSPIALELACTLGEWWYSSKKYSEVIATMSECAQEHLVDGNQMGAANDLHLLGMAYRELKQYTEALEAFKEARGIFKSEKEVLHVARCDQKIASCYNWLGDGEKALEASLEEGLNTLDGVLQIIADDEPKDFEFIVDIESRMADVMRALGRVDEAAEIERRLTAVRDTLSDGEQEPLGN